MCICDIFLDSLLKVGYICYIYIYIDQTPSVVKSKKTRVFFSNLELSRGGTPL